MSRRRVIGLLLLTGGLGFAEEAGMELSGFRVPEYTREGEMKSQLFGEHAVVRPDGWVEIETLEVEFYREGRTTARITSPKCFYNRENKTAEADQPVRIELDKLTVTGRDYELFSADSRFVLKKEVRVVLREVNMGFKPEKKKDE
jgi:hypothetical protein